MWGMCRQQLNALNADSTVIIKVYGKDLITDTSTANQDQF